LSCWRFRISPNSSASSRNASFVPLRAAQVMNEYLPNPMFYRFFLNYSGDPEQAERLLVW